MSVDLLSGGTFPNFIGVVEDREDEDMRRRVRVRCYGIHTDDKTQIPTNTLPWARVALPTTAPRNSTLDLWEGTLVYGVFLDGTSYQQPLVLGIIETYDNKNKPNKGFNDPRTSPVVTKPEEEEITSETNSITSYADESLYENTLAAKLKEEPVEIGETYIEPENPAKPEYPYNHVEETESGHVIEWDDTPGAERVHIMHRSGTYIELFPNGDMVHKSTVDTHNVTIENKYEAIGDDYNLEVAGDVNINVVGNANINVEGNSVQEIAGDANIDVAGNVTESVGGNYDIDAGGVFSISASLINLNS